MVSGDYIHNRQHDPLTREPQCTLAVYTFIYVNN